LMGLSGLAYLAQGWVSGSEGFSAANQVPTLLGYVLILAWSVWLLILAWGRRRSLAARVWRPRRWQWPLSGIAIGKHSPEIGVIFATAPAAALTRLLGAFLLAVVVYRHTPFGRRTRIGLRGFALLGLASGAISAVLGSVGPFMAPFFLTYGLVKGAYIGSEALSTVVMHVTKTTVYGRYALLGVQTAATDIAIGVVMLVGSYLGKRLWTDCLRRCFPTSSRACWSWRACSSSCRASAGSDRQSRIALDT
jgi:uncharacterized membrane protein YfcA